MQLTSGMNVDTTLDAAPTTGRDGGNPPSAMSCAAFAGYKAALQEGDYASAAARLVGAADMGHPDALYHLAYSNDYGTLGFSINATVGLQMYRQAAEARSPHAMASYAVTFGDDQDEQRTMWAMHAVETGNLFALGLLYEFGAGVDIDEVRAMQLYEAAAEQGDQWGAHWGAELLQRFLEDDPSPEGRAKLRKLLLRAVELGDHAFALHHLASMAREEGDATTMMDLWRLPIRQGFPPSLWECALVHFYENDAVCKLPNAAALRDWAKAASLLCRCLAAVRTVPHIFDDWVRYLVMRLLREPIATADRDERLRELFQYGRVFNSGLITVRNNTKVNDIEDSARHVHSASVAAARAACVAFLSLRKGSVGVVKTLPRDIALLIARSIFDTREDPARWGVSVDCGPRRSSRLLKKQKK